MVSQCEICQGETQERETGSLSPGKQVEKARNSNCKDEKCPAMWMKDGAIRPHRMTTERIDQQVHRKPSSQRPAIGQPGEGREKQRYLRPVERDVQTVWRLCHKFAGQIRLCTHVVQKISAALQLQATQGVEV